MIHLKMIHLIKRENILHQIYRMTNGFHPIWCFTIEQKKFNKIKKKY